MVINIVLQIKDCNITLGILCIWSLRCLKSSLRVGIFIIKSDDTLVFAAVILYIHGYLAPETQCVFAHLLAYRLSGHADCISA